MDTSTEASVLLFKLGDSAFEVRELCLSAVAGVLGGYSVAVCTSLFTLLGGDGRAGTFARRLVGRVGTGVISRAGRRSRALEGRGGEGEGGRVDESTVLCHGARRVVRKGNTNNDMVKGDWACSVAAGGLRRRHVDRTRSTLYTQYTHKHDHTALVI